MRRTWGLVAAAATVALLALLVLRWRPFRVEVAGRSMEPTLHPGDYLVVSSPRRIRRGDVVVLARPGRDMEVVKRVAAIPGDLVEGEQLSEGWYLVVGDNEAVSTDGRVFGPVSREAIRGVVRFRYWPRPGRV